MNPVIQLFSNPLSGSYSTRLVADLRAEFVLQGATVIDSESSPRQRAVIDPRADRVCVVGGDGTVRHVAIAITNAGRAVPLIPYPGGTVNLMQLEIRLPTQIEAFVSHALATTAPTRQFSVRINDTAFLACASVGPDSYAVAALSEGLKRWIGKLAYVVAFLGVLWRWPRSHITLTTPQQAIDCEAFYIAKGRFFAGPWSFAPDARLDVPLLHVVTIAHLSRWIYLRFSLAMLLRRDVARLPGVTTFECAALEANSVTALPVQGDGDIVCQLPARILLQPAGYEVLR